MSYVTNDTNTEKETRYVPANTAYIVAIMLFSAFAVWSFVMQPGFFYPHRALEHGPSLQNIKLPVAMR